MEKAEIKHSRYFFIICFVLIILFSLILLYPFLTTILGSVIITYIFYPVYNKLFLLIKNKNIASLIMSFIILLLVIIPVIIIANAVIKESVGLYYEIRNLNLGIEDLSKTFLAKYIGNDIEIADYIKNALSKFSIALLQKTDNFILELPSKIINFFVMFFIIFYLFKDGKNFIEKLKNELPLKERYKQNLIKSFNDTLYATVYGVLGAAFVQGIVAIMGFYIFKVDSPLFLGFLVFIAAILPIFGSALIWLPLGIIKIISGDSFNGIGLLIYGLVVISTIDNIIKAKLIERGAKLHPVLALLGVLAGLQVLGLLGIIIGPIILAIAVVFFEFYLLEKRESIFKRQ